MDVRTARHHISPVIKQFFDEKKYNKEFSNTRVAKIRSDVGKALSKMKNYTVNVFDQCIAFNDDNSPSEFEISLELTKHGTDKKRVMHLTGIISESETVRNANQQKMQSA